MLICTSLFCTFSFFRSSSSLLSLSERKVKKNRAPFLFLLLMQSKMDCGIEHLSVHHGLLTWAKRLSNELLTDVMPREAEFLRSRRTPCAEREALEYLARLAFERSALYSRFSFVRRSFSSRFSFRRRSSASTVFAEEGVPASLAAFRPFLKAELSPPRRPKSLIVEERIEFATLLLEADFDRMARTWGGGRWYIMHIDVEALIFLLALSFHRVEGSIAYFLSSKKQLESRKKALSEKH